MSWYWNNREKVLEHYRKTYQRKPFDPDKVSPIPASARLKMSYAKIGNQNAKGFHKMRNWKSLFNEIQIPRQTSLR